MDTSEHTTTPTEERLHRALKKERELREEKMRHSEQAIKEIVAALTQRKDSVTSLLQRCSETVGQIFKNSQTLRSLVTSQISDRAEDNEHALALPIGQIWHADELNAVRLCLVWKADGVWEFRLLQKNTRDRIECATLWWHSPHDRVYPGLPPKFEEFLLDLTDEQKCIERIVSSLDNLSID